MSVDEGQLQQWWDALSEEQQGQLKKAVRSYPVDRSVVDLLLSSNLEAVKGSWTATSIAHSPSSLAIHDPVKKFVESKIEHE